MLSDGNTCNDQSSITPCPSHTTQPKIADGDIYNRLVHLEARCISLDAAYSLKDYSEIDREQWQKLITAHIELLNQYYDLFSVSQSPSASQLLKNIARNYQLPIRMWRDGILSLLELLRHKLPNSLDLMLDYIYFVYGMMGLFYESIPLFKSSWVEYLGDVAFYRIAIQDCTEDRATWVEVSRSWYEVACQMSPSKGRLYFQFAILNRSNVVEKLYLYVKSLCTGRRYPRALEKISALLNPFLQLETVFNSTEVFLHAYAIMLSGGDGPRLTEVSNMYIEILKTRVHLTDEWEQVG